MTPSASAPVIAGLCPGPSPQNGQIASADPVHVGASLIGEVHGPSGSPSQQPTLYSDGRHPMPTNSARTELPQHLDPTTGNGVPLQSSGQGKQGKLTLQQLRDLTARSQTRKFSSTNYVNGITELYTLRPFLHPVSSI